MPLKNKTNSNVDILVNEEILKLYSLNLLDSILKDQTTGKNIIWGTDDYEYLGTRYSKEKEISSKLITGKHSELLKNRAAKDAAQQIERIHEHAEVFTPVWVCEKMNNLVDEIWCGKAKFSKKGKFNCSKILGIDWKEYVNSKFLEITCGEAPFIVSRYDASNGEAIKIQKRIGALDRKIQIVSKNARNETDWINWVYKAFQSVYGYDFQGDNVLIARLNMVISFEDYMLEKWNRQPTDEEYQSIINIVTWNIWQMDGFSGGIPYQEPRRDHEQLSLFGANNPNSCSNKNKKQFFCSIYDWTNERRIEYAKMKERNLEIMKFDFVIGNPPYQEDVSIVDTKNGQKASRSIFQFFQMQVDGIANISSVLIYPGDRWIHRSGKGMKEFGLYQINDPHLARLDYYPISREVFSSVDIASGISIVCKKYNKNVPGFEYRYIKNGSETIMNVDNPGQALLVLNPEDIGIMEKIDNFILTNNLGYLHDRIFPQKLFGIESDFVEKNPDRVRPYVQGSDFDPVHEVKLLANDRAGQSGRTAWFIASRDLIRYKSQRYIDEWQVVVSSFTGGGQKRDNHLEIIDNQSAFGRARVALRSFKSKEEAENFYKYVDSCVIRFTFLMTDESLTSLGKRVPDMLDYTNDNGLIDFSKNVDEQLAKLIQLTDDEYTYVKNRVNSLRKKQYGD